MCSRLTPPYMVVMAVWAILFPYMGSGPLWSVMDGMSGMCRSWWRNPLYINNLFPSAQDVRLSRCHSHFVCLSLSSYYMYIHPVCENVNICFYIARVSSRLNRSKHFTLHPWQTCSFRHQLNFSVKHSSHAAISHEEYSLTFLPISIYSLVVI